MGDRQVSESRPQARLLRVSEAAGGIAVAAGSRPGLRSSRAIAGAPPTPGIATRMHPGGADRPPGSREQVEDFFTTFRRLRRLYDQHSRLTDLNFKRDYYRAEDRLKNFVKRRFKRFGGEFNNLHRYYGRVSKAEQAYTSLQEKARRADNDGNRERASAIRDALVEIDRYAAEDLQMFSETYGPAPPSPTRAPPQTPATAAPTFDWCMVYRQLLGIRQYFEQAGQLEDAQYFQKTAGRLEMHVRYRFKRYCGKGAARPPLDSTYRSRTEQRYRAFEDLVRRTETARGGAQAANLRQAMEDMNSSAIKELGLLTRKYGPLEDLVTRAGLPPQPALLGATRMVTGAVTSGSETGSAEVPTVTELLSQPPGPSSRVMPAQAPRTPTASAPELPLARREAIVERFKSRKALLHAGFTLGYGGVDVLGWAAARTQRVLNDLDRLHSSARDDPRAAAALPDVDWDGIEALTGMMDLPSLPP